jgi:hypothetical protein
LLFTSCQTRPAIVPFPFGGAGSSTGTTTFVRTELLPGLVSFSLVLTVARTKLPGASGELSASDTGAGVFVAAPVQRQS